MLLSFDYSMECLRSDELYCEKWEVLASFLFGAFICGMGTSLLWITQTVYITDCSNPYNKDRMFTTFSSFLTVS